MNRILIPFVFILLGAAGILTHEPSLEEAHSWQLISASHSVREMIAHLGYTGHTLTFFVWQYFLYQFFHTPIAGSIANLLFMTAAIIAFVRTAPFSALQKWLFVLGFYPLYQYTIFNRMYAFLIFFLFVYCALYATKPKRTLLRWVMLILMAETHVIGMLSAVPLAILDLIRHWHHEMSSRVERLLCGFKLLFFLFAVISATWQILPADEAYHHLHPDSPLAVFSGFASAFLPNFGIFLQSHLQIVIGLILWGIAIIALWRHRSTLTTYLALCLPLALFLATIFPGQRWQHGCYWIYWVIALWLAGSSWHHDRRLQTLVTSLFALQAAMGIYALGVDILTYERLRGILVTLPVFG